MAHRVISNLLKVAAFYVLGLLGTAAVGASATPAEVREAVANANVEPAGVHSPGIQTIDLVARPASWRPREQLAPSVSVYAFSGSDGTPTIPGPFIRAAVGEEVVLRIRNEVPPGRAIGLPPPNRRYDGIRVRTGDRLVVRGFERALGIGPVEVPYGQTVEIRGKAQTPGDYFYWASTSGRPLRSRTGPEAQLTGLLIVDEPDERRDPAERFFLMTMTDAFPAPESGTQFEDMFEPAINGRSWPKTERLNYRIGERVRWRWINGSGFEHPMHLHGFHFKTLETGHNGGRAVRGPGEVQEVVTEFMEPGSTFRMEWTPIREGNWLVHCHIRDHVAGEPDPHGDHDMSAEDHAKRAMFGLVLGISVSPAGVEEVDGVPSQTLRLVAMSRASELPGVHHQGYAISEGEGALSAFSAPGPLIVLTRGETTRITIENRMDEPTNVHWHGLELQSIYDGVSGWSGTRGRVAPLVKPGETFDVFINPPRSGTFMYHTHMDATSQITNGMYGPLIVLDPGETFDPDRDKVFVLADAIDGRYRGVAINGKRAPAPVVLEAGKPYRFRFINISEGSTLNVALRSGPRHLDWSPLAKDGASLPRTLRTRAPAAFTFGAGETYDFTFTPVERGSAELEIEWEFPTEVGGLTLRQPLVVQ